MRSRASDSRAATAGHATADAAAEPPSKSQRKRDMLALQTLGESLLALPDDKLVRLPIDASLLDAVRLAREIRSREGRRRQIQYIGRLMREADADALRQALAVETHEQRATTATMHAAERWRERLIAGDAGLREWLSRHPDTQAAITALLPRARQEHAAGQPGRAYRELFRRLRDRLGAPDRPGAQDTASPPQPAASARKTALPEKAAPPKEAPHHD